LFRVDVAYEWLNHGLRLDACVGEYSCQSIAVKSGEWKQVDRKVSTKGPLTIGYRSAIAQRERKRFVSMDDEVMRGSNRSLAQFEGLMVTTNKTNKHTR
jgi:hypothetical protein